MAARSKLEAEIKEKSSRIDELEKLNAKLKEEKKATFEIIEGEKDYYEIQLLTLKSFEEVDSIVQSEGIDEDDLDEQAQHERSMKISNYANIILLVLKIYVTIKSGSIAIAASTLDYLLGLMDGGILWFTHFSMKSINIYRYPIGKLRVQPVGIIIFVAIMATLE
ncbi:metal tolerance protein 4-like [Humulus lupulus]|uniref:metal tolerance protein 4-like n=1 Tax=Humulus lupulus TaxID=3486 RepID=UPI002B40DF3D|nr:metal tolerance protein 4-like [Humulus lupulus]